MHTGNDGTIVKCLTRLDGTVGGHVDLIRHGNLPILVNSITFAI